METDLPADEALKPLKKLVLDLSDKDIITVNDLKKVVQQEEYIAKFKAPDRPNLSKRTGTFAPVEGIKQEDFTPKPAGKPKKSASGKTKPSTHIVPKNCKLNVTNTKIAEIYEELKSLQLIKHRNAIAVLLRVFLETSVDHYLTSASISLTFSTPNGNKDKSLKKKVDETIADMVSKGAILKDFAGITKGLSDVNHPFSPDILHAYVHNRFMTPMIQDLTAAWSHGQPLFERIWPV